jgi:hypothetical protein
MDIRRTIRLPEFQLHTFIISLFLLTHFLVFLFRSYSFGIASLPGIIYSEAVLAGIDPGKRVSLFYLAAAGSVVFGFLIHFLVSLAVDLFKLKNRQLQSLSMISVTGMMMVFFHLAGWNVQHLNGLLLLLFFLKVLFYGIGNRPEGKHRQLAKETFFSVSFAVAFLLSFSMLFFFNSRQVIWENFNLLLTAATVGTAFLLTKFREMFSARKQLYFLIPLSFIPLWAFFSGEIIIFSKLVNDSLIRYKLVFAGLATVSFAAHLLICHFRKLPVRISSRKILEKYLLPSVLFAVALLAFYSPVQPQSTELFELANPANTLIRVFSMQQIPLIDYMSSHMLSEQWHGLLHDAIFGFTTHTGFQAWKFLNLVILIFIIYWLMNRLFPEKELSVLLIVSFPFLFQVFFEHLIPAALVMYMSVKCLESPTIRNFSGLFFSLLITILWRLDTGSAALFTALIFVPVMFLSARKAFPFRNFLKGFGIFMMFIIVSLFIAIIIRSPQHIADNFMAALHYVRANLAHGYSFIAFSYPHQFYVHHFLMPAASLLAMVHMVLTLRKYDLPAKGIGYIAFASIFFFLIYLSNAQRGLVRHSFAHTDAFLASVFYLSLSLYILWFVRSRTATFHNYLIFYPTAILVFFILKFFPLRAESVLWDRAFTQGAYKNFDLHFGEQPFSRIIINEEFSKNTFEEIKSFLDANLTDEQTFLDFSNTPMLYYYCNRSIPGYFNQNLQNTVDDFLQIHLLRQVDTEKVPVVIYENVPRTWFDETDGVPNVMRYYLIAGYIFSNYRPLGILNNKHIWVNRNSTMEWQEIQEHSFIPNPETYRYKKAAWLTGKYFERSTSNFLTEVFHQEHSEAEIFQPNIHIPENIGLPANAFIKLRISSQQDHNETVLRLFSGETEVGSFTFEVVKGVHDYYLRAGNHYLIHLMPVSGMIFEHQPGTGIESVTILKDNRLENPYTNHH